MGGKKKDKKKKGLGAEKTAAKMEKKITAKLKKELAIRGEDDVESMIAKFVEEDRKKNTRTVTEAPIDRPSKRSSFTLVAHPTKDLLLMFGGEWCSGKSTILYNDLFSYDIKKQKWAKLECPGGPPPRSSHQAACIAGDGGQMWVFGGEFASPSESQFYHYRDLWVFQLKDRRWEKIETKGGPSGRSGHRMVVLQTPNFPPRLAIFGGFHDSLRGDCRYYNDFHLFDLSERVWRKIDIAGQPPAPRSGHLMAALPDGRIFIHGGFSKVKVAGSKKKGGDDEVGMVHTDSFFLTPDKRDTTGTKFKWVQVKSSGQVPSKRCSSTLAAWTESGKSQAVVFGGVFDTEDEEDRLSDSDEETEDDSTGIFYDELYSVDLTKPSWKLVELTGPRVVEGGEKKRRRRKSKGEGDVEEDESDEEDDEEEEEEKEEEAKMPEQEVKTVDDGVFTVTIGPSSTQTQPSKRTHDSTAEGATAAVPKTGPSPRMSSGMTIKNGVLYSFGGLFERSNGATVTYSDFYSLDLKKLDEWKCLLEPAEDEAMEVDESEEEDEDDEEEESDEDDDDDEDCDDDEGEVGASAMQVG